MAKARGKDAGRVSKDLIKTGAVDYLQQTFAPDKKKVKWVEETIGPWIYLNRGVTRPSDTSATAFEIVNPPDGGCLTLDEFSSPILEPGLYRLGIQNRSAVAQKVHLRMLIKRGSLADRTFTSDQ